LGVTNFTFTQTAERYRACYEGVRVVLRIVDAAYKEHE
jgi:hypothetical protein